MTSSSTSRPPLVVLTSGLYWCLGIGASAFAIFLFSMRETFAEIFRDFGVDPAAAPPPTTDSMTEMLRTLATMSQFFAVLCGMAGLVAAVSLMGATFLFLRRRVGLNALLTLTWALGVPMLFLCLWAIFSQGVVGVLTLVQCVPFALLLVLLYSKPVQNFCTAPALA